MRKMKARRTGNAQTTATTSPPSYMTEKSMAVEEADDDSRSTIDGPAAATALTEIVTTTSICLSSCSGREARGTLAIGST